MQVLEELVHLGDGQVRDGVEVVRAVAPFGEVADVGLAGVAGAGHDAPFRVGNSVERYHAQARGDIGDRHVGELRHALERGELGLAHGRQIDGARLDVELLGDLHAVVPVHAVIAPAGAGHDDAEGVVARGLAEYAHEGRVLAAGVAVDNAPGVRGLQPPADELHALFKFHLVVSHENDLPPLGFPPKLSSLSCAEAASPRDGFHLNNIPHTPTVCKRVSADPALRRGGRCRNLAAFGGCNGSNP